MASPNGHKNNVNPGRHVHIHFYSREFLPALCHGFFNIEQNSNVLYPEPLTTELICSIHIPENKNVSSFSCTRLPETS